jgi:hypothetical protein
MTSAPVRLSASLPWLAPDLRTSTGCWRDAFGDGDAAIADVARAGARASFTPADVRAQLLSGIDARLA